jgi:hypothetical protein
MAYEPFKKLDGVKHGRTIKSLIGMRRAHFDSLAVAFALAYDAVPLDRLQQGDIQQVPSGGSKGYLDTFDKQLFFLLYDPQKLPRLRRAGLPFWPQRRARHTPVIALLPVLQRALLDLGVRPARTPGTPQEFAPLVEQYGDIAIDGMECPGVRPQDDERQKARFSGKKRHPLTAITVSPLHRQMLFLVCFFAGSSHD